MASTSDSPASVADTRLWMREAALLAAERFLADTSETINPDTPAPALLHYAARYRAHLAAVVAASRHPAGGRPARQHMKTPVRARSRT